MGRDLNSPVFSLGQKVLEEGLSLEGVLMTGRRMGLDQKKMPWVAFELHHSLEGVLVTGMERELVQRKRPLIALVPYHFQSFLCLMIPTLLRK